MPTSLHLFGRSDVEHAGHANPAWTEWLGAERARLAQACHALTCVRFTELESAPHERAALAKQLLNADPPNENTVVALWRLSARSRASGRATRNVQVDQLVRPHERVPSLQEPEVVAPGSRRAFVR